MIVRISLCKLDTLQPLQTRKVVPRASEAFVSVVNALDRLGMSPLGEAISRVNLDISDLFSGSWDRCHSTAYT